MVATVSCVCQPCLCPAASQVLELESQSDLVFEEGVASAVAERGVASAVAEEGVASVVAEEGVSKDLAGIWECYYNWSLERWQEETSYKVVRKRVRVVSQLANFFSLREGGREGGSSRA